MIIQTPDNNWVDPNNPHFQCPDYLKALACDHFYIKATSSFKMEASKFLTDILGIFTSTQLDYDMYFNKTEIKCIHCGLANVRFTYIF